jgi:plastocyanin
MQNNANTLQIKITDWACLPDVLLITMTTMYRARGHVLLQGPGRVAFPIIIALGAVTGVLTYMAFSQASPGPLFTSAKLFEPSPFAGIPAGTLEGEGGQGVGETGTAAAGQQTGSNASGQNQSGSAAIPPDAVTITIPSGASTQGNPAYDPDPAEAEVAKTIAWKNDDSTPHTATSEGGFDSSIINPGESYTISAEEIGAGEHQYTCTVHPFMKGTLVIK